MSIVVQDPPVTRRRTGGELAAVAALAVPDPARLRAEIAAYAAWARAAAGHVEELGSLPRLDFDASGGGPGGLEPRLRAHVDSVQSLVAWAAAFGAVVEVADPDHRDERELRRHVIARIPLPPAADGLQGAELRLWTIARIPTRVPAVDCLLGLAVTA